MSDLNSQVAQGSNCELTDLNVTINIHDPEKLKYYSLSSLAAAAASPLNEGVRYSIFGIAEGLSRSPLVGAAAFGISTLGVEGIGALAASYAFDNNLSNKVFEYINRRALPRIGIREDAKLSTFTKLNVLQFGGSVAYMALLQREDPDRNLEQNLRTGMKASVLLAGATAVQGALMSEGINIGLDHSLEIGLGAFGLAFLAAAGRKGLELYKTKKYYENLKPVGPQLEGIDPDNFKKALHDRSSIREKIYGKVSLPILVPLKYATWINGDFFAKKGYNPDELLYSSAPQNSYEDKDKGFILDIFQKARQKGFKGIVFDYFEDNEVFESILDKESIDNLETAHGPAQIFQYHMKLRANENKLADFKPNPNVRTIEPEDLDKHFDQIWSIYSSQFQELVDDHPVRGQLTPKELREVLSSDDCLLKAYFDDKGNILSFGYLVTDLKLCPWLNERYFEEVSDGNPTGYFSGIASAKNSRVVTSFYLVNSFAYEMAKKWPKGNLAFECSNTSARYIPKIVKRCFEKDKLYEIDSMSERAYHYKLIKLSHDRT